MCWSFRLTHWFGAGRNSETLLRTTGVLSFSRALQTLKEASCDGWRILPAGHAYAGHCMTVRDFAQVRVNARALRNRRRAARAKTAARRRIDGRGHIAL